jgi:hypothetical protein
MTSKNAKELCAMLITRALKDLNDDEEEIVVDYLEKLRIKTKLSMKPRELCLLLLEKTMEQEYGKGKTIPLTAYANSLLNKESEATQQKQKVIREVDLKLNRSRSQKNLESMSNKLPGCLVSENNIFSRNIYNLIIDPELGIVNLEDGTSQYAAMISVSTRLYENIFLANETPIIEIRTNKGFKAYAKLGAPHEGSDNEVYISPLVAYILNIEAGGSAFLQLCISLPNIAHVKFTFYGNRSELDLILKDLIAKLPSVINAFSYLSLGMILTTTINGKEVQVRVDSLRDDTERPIFAGVLPFAESDLPFEIDPDL